MASPGITSPLLLSILFLSFLPGGAPDLAADGTALLALRAAVARSTLTTWNTTTSPCSWQGVTCDGNRVVELHLPGTGLMGVLPDNVLGNLTALRTLSLRFNVLTGTLPGDLAKLVELRNLYLQSNHFTGEVPAVLFSMSNLMRLNLEDNSFTGTLSPDFDKLTRLGTLLLGGNKFFGEIPSWNLTGLVQFNVSYTQVNGSIPAKLRKMPKDSFLGTGLCGGPLGPCPGENSLPPAESPAGDNGTGGSGVNAAGEANKKKLSGGAIAGIAIGCAIFVLLLIGLVLFLCRKRSGAQKSATTVKATDITMAAIGSQGKEINGATAAARGMPPTAAAAGAVATTTGGGGAKKLTFFGKMATAPPFDLEVLLRASAEVLGKGMFGTAYKAVLENGAAVAVKRLKDVDLQEGEFKERIAAIGKIEHELVVPLRAYYFSKDEKLLVYDYMPMGSLSALLHGNNASGRSPLDWEARSAIALDAARGIAYIHSTGPSASHGNIKSSNILLVTKSYEVRVSDHGLPTLVGPSFSPTSRVSGYRAPEVTDICRVSQKADVYSFGVLLLELLTGKAPSQAVLDEEGVDLPRWVQSVVREEWTVEVFDQELLRCNNVEEEMVQLLQLAMDCSAQHPDRRPAMSEVVARIDEIRRSSLGDRQTNPDSIGDGDGRSEGARHNLL